MSRNLPINQIWIAYNHMPAGQIVVQHFEDVTRKKKTSEDSVQEIEFSAETQIAGFKNSDFVARYVMGKLEKNQILIFPKDKDLRRNPRAADVVIAWAKEQGMTPVPVTEQPKKETITTVAIDPRVSELEKSLAEMKTQNAQLDAQNKSTDAKCDQILLLLQGMQTNKDNLKEEQETENAR